MVTIIVPLFLLSLFVFQVSSCDQIDKLSLLAFSGNISTSPPYPSLDWSDSLDCCSWEGITCDGDLRVTHLLLPSRGLTGFISPSLTNLSSLSQLNLSHNRLSGTLQHHFFSLLNHLLVLDLSYNRLSGELPPFVGDISGKNSSGGVIQELDLSRWNNFLSSSPSPCSILMQSFLGRDQSLEP